MRTRTPADVDACDSRELADTFMASFLHRNTAIDHSLFHVCLISMTIEQIHCKRAYPEQIYHEEVNSVEDQKRGPSPINWIETHFRYIFLYSGEQKKFKMPEEQENCPKNNAAWRNVTSNGKPTLSVLRRTNLQRRKAKSFLLPSPKTMFYSAKHHKKLWHKGLRAKKTSQEKNCYSLLLKRCIKHYASPSTKVMLQCIASNEKAPSLGNR